MATMKLATTVCALLLLSAMTVSARGPKWDQLKGYTYQQYTRDYGKKPCKVREQIFNAALSDITAHNANKQKTYTMGVNQFTDMTQEEMREYNKMKRPSQETLDSLPRHTANEEDVMGLPKSVDYRTHTNPSVLTAVKNQGACGACWAFSTVETLESHFAIATGQLPVLSPQQVTSCTESEDGCGGGTYFGGWSYIKHNSTGLNEEWLYPFTEFFVANATKAGTSACKNITAMWDQPNIPGGFPWVPKANVTGQVLVDQNSASATMHAVATKGPLSIAVAAVPWMHYEGGILQNNFSAYGNATWEIDHAVQLVGYGHDFDLQMNYWIVRNSWGTEFGENGYIRLARPDVEPCDDFMGTKECGTSGVLTYPGYPIPATLDVTNP